MIYLNLVQIRVLVVFFSLVEKLGHVLQIEDPDMQNSSLGPIQVREMPRRGPAEEKKHG